MEKEGECTLCTQMSRTVCVVRKCTVTVLFLIPGDRKGKRESSVH